MKTQQTEDTQRTKSSIFFSVISIVIVMLLTSAEVVFCQTPPQYTVTDLGTLGGIYSYAQGINNKGQIVGFSYTTGNNNEHAFLWSNGSMQDLGILPIWSSIYASSYAYGINNSGQVVGWSDVGNGNEHGFLLSSGVMQDLGTLAGSSSSLAYAINNSGQIVGYSDLENSRAFLWSSGSMKSLGGLGGNSVAYSINDNGQAVGYAITTSNLAPVLYSNGTVYNLGKLPGGGYSSPANAINNGGQIVGSSGSDAFVYQNGSMHDIGSGAAFGINNEGQIVGDNYNNNHAFLYENGSMYDLNNYMALNSGDWTLMQATAINDNGQIVGNGVNSFGEQHALLLTPLPAGALQAASTVQMNLPVYPTTPVTAPVYSGLVLITHGAIAELPDPLQVPSEKAAATNFVNGLSNAIAEYFTANNITDWQVDGQMWTDQATAINPEQSLISAEQIGVNLGNAILAEQDRVPGSWINIHFIAHSAGAGMIQKATEVIKAVRGNTVTIHCTFLDAFDGELGEMTEEYGSSADWADSYFVRSIFEQQGFTGRLLPNAYNVDVTALDPTASLQSVFESENMSSSCYTLMSNHGWPPLFYINSSEGNPPPVYESSYYNGFGFPLGEEAGIFPIGLTKALYPPGNGLTYGTVQDLGNDYGCVPPYLIPPFYTGPTPGFSTGSTVESTTGTVQASLGTALVGTGSPVWLSTVITDTNALNTVSFDAEFTSASGADGLLTVYWDTNMIGEVDEAMVLPGLQHYDMQFPNTTPNTSHVLGFHVDPFTAIHSSLILTNVVTGCVGVSQSPILTVTTSQNGLFVYQLAGQLGVYTMQTTTNLASTNWVNLGVLVNTVGVVNFVDQSSTNNFPYQFYRVMIPNGLTQ